jgi:hypothetical protein
MVLTGGGVAIVERASASDRIVPRAPTRVTWTQAMTLVSERSATGNFELNRVEGATAPPSRSSWSLLGNPSGILGGQGPPGPAM